MLYQKIKSQIEDLNTNSISLERKNTLQPLIDFIQTKVDTNTIINLNFICTHNSRRSHLSQVWAQTLAHYFNIKNVFSYSGGTEATALFPSAAEALENSGFKNTPQQAEKYKERSLQIATELKYVFSKIK